MPVHPQTRRLREFLDSCAELLGPDPSIEEMRRLIGSPFALERRELPHVRDLTVHGEGGPVPVRLYRPAGRSPLPALVYFHGGGWVIGGPDNVDAACREFAARAGCAVLSVDYRLAPEHPFPAAVQDAWAVTAAATGEPGRFGVDPQAVAVAGDSAGGNLAAVVALLARERGVRLVHQLLVYPATDTAMDTASYAAYGTGYGLDAGSMGRFMRLYQGDADPADPRLAPLRAPDLAGAAPATVITAEYDVLRDEGEAYARRLQEAGVPVLLRRYEGMVHSFFLLPELFDTGVEAMDLAVRRLRAAFETPGNGTAPIREDTRWARRGTAGTSG
ncbi:alpha/beta hydrolase [Actinomadura sp. 9N407]|uniref:alpha/beta hydrolase n=1 Tax=Actinomadura sp. 9N407 TaxID=3375154 RepID=UPI0037B34FA9